MLLGGKGAWKLHRVWSLLMDMQVQSHLLCLQYTVLSSPPANHVIHESGDLYITAHQPVWPHSVSIGRTC